MVVSFMLDSNYRVQPQCIPVYRMVVSFMLDSNYRVQPQCIPVYRMVVIFILDNYRQCGEGIVFMVIISVTQGY